MSTAQQVAWNTISQVVARTVALALSLVTVVVVARYLGVRGYGNFTAVTVYLSIFIVFFDWGISTILVRQLAQRTEPAPELLGKAVTLRLLLGILVTGFAAGGAFLVYGGDKVAIRNGILIALPTIALAAFSSTLTTLFQAELKMGWVVPAEIAAQAVATGLALLFVALDAGFYAVVSATVVGGAVQALLVYVLFRRISGLRPRVDVEAWKELFLRALPLGIALVLNVVYFRLDAFLLSVLKGSRDVGIYGIAFRFSEMLIPFALYFVTSVFPLLAASAAEQSEEQLNRLTQRAFDVLAVAAIPIVLGTLVVAPEIVRLLGGAEFSASATPLRIVIVGTGLTFVNTLLAYLIVAVDRQKDALWLNLLAVLLNLALNLVLIPPYGYVAAASVATASECVVLVGLLWMANRFARVRLSLATALRTGIAGGLMFTAVALAHPSLVVAVAIGIVVYGAALFLLRVPQAIEVEQIFVRRAH